MPTRLFNCHHTHAWHALPWTSFHAKDGPRIHAVQPIYSLSDWCLGAPLDAEEVVGSQILNEALNRFPGFQVRVLPPFRFTPRQSIATSFAVDIEGAHQSLRETLRSVSVSGVRRIILYNTSPFLEEWIDAAARDLRIDDDLQTFCVNLSGLGLDFHPVRGGERKALKNIIESLCGSLEAAEGLYRAEDLDPLSGATHTPVEPMGLPDATGEDLYHQAADRLSRLLREIAEHPPLTDQRPNPRETV